jgi:DNA replication and repair protein RecF
MSLQPFRLELIKLTNFKNYGYGEFDFSPKLNFIVGNNGLGKTNLLDAIYYSCLTKSYLTSSDVLAANFSADFFRIESHFTLGHERQLVEIKYLKNERKEVWLNHGKMERQSDFIGRFPVVIITPDDNQLILGGSELRRKFMDATLCQFSGEYFINLITYNKVLSQRNALLKSFYENRTFDANLLEVYNKTLIHSGVIIHHWRKNFIAQLNPLFNLIYTQIFDGNETAAIVFESDVNGSEYSALLRESEAQDRIAQRTTKGIHTDDLIFSLSNYPLKKTGSQGQQKTFLLSLKLAQYE